MSRLSRFALVVAAVLAAAVLAGEAVARGGGTIQLTFAGRYAGTGAEISAFDPISKRLFVTDAAGRKVDILDLSNAAAPTKVGELSVAPGSPNSVAVHAGVVAVAVQAETKTDPGTVAFFRARTGAPIAAVTVGAQPDMLTFAGARWLLVANEGEPNDDYTVDPQGSVSVVDLLALLLGRGQAAVRTAGFAAYDGREDDLRLAGVRIFGPDASASEDFEPEYIAASATGHTAWITLQENNAVATLDVTRARITAIEPLGAKDHSLARNGLDPSDRDDGIAIGNWPVRGLYLPDAVATLRHRGQTYLVTANEGDAREWGPFAEEARVKDLDLDPTAFPNADYLQDDAAIGRLTVTTTLGDTDGDGDYDELYAFGARSFSIWSSSGGQVFDSGDQLERITAEQVPELFNSELGDPGEFDKRSDNKGPEPEGLVVGEVRGKDYLFVGLERPGGVAVYDVTNPFAPSFVQYVTPPVPAENAAPEGLTFIPASENRGQALLVVTNEGDEGVGSSTVVYRIGPVS